jgi:hypothetical protein
MQTALTLTLSQRERGQFFAFQDTLLGRQLNCRPNSMSATDVMTASTARDFMEVI